MKIIRVQDRFGRGPWRPGLSSKWVDDNRDFSLPPIFLEIPNFASICDKAHANQLHVGCAVVAERFQDWFTKSEIKKLRGLGFRPVNATLCIILAKTPTQILIASKSPLSKLTRLSWQFGANLKIEARK